jgi:isoquinoline 1-oxidoreductase subunit beta
MVRPARPERNRTARSFRQLRRFHHVINSDKVFGTHTRLNIAEPCSTSRHAPRRSSSSPRNGPAGGDRCRPAAVGAFRSYTRSAKPTSPNAEVSVSNEGDVRVQRVVCAVDCGTIVNPDTVKAQMESGIIFGITAALFGEITIKDGRVEQANFDDYRILRINEAPLIDVHLVKSTEAPGGVGEPGTSAVMPAVANAIFAATGKRIRKLPIDSAQLK